MILESRENELKKVLRYGLWESPIFYKANLWIHTQRVSWIAENIALFLQKSLHIQIDSHLVKNLALVHDDEEIITGDIVGPQKESFSPEEKEKHEELCKNAIPLLEENYGENDFWGFSYESLLRISQSEKQSIEFIVMKYADKVDAHMEVLHEAFAGNTAFYNEVLEKFQITPYDFTYNNIEKHLQKILDFLGLEKESISQNVFLNIVPRYTSEYVLKKWEGQHTQNSIKKESGIHSYDFWKSLHFSHGDTDAQEYLYIQREF